MVQYRRKSAAAPRRYAKPLGKAQREQVVKITKNVVARQVEKGQKMVSISNTASTAGSFHSLSDITVGTADGQRLKHEIEIKSLHLNLIGTHADPTNIMRVIVFQYFDVDFPTTAKLMQDTGVDSYLSPMNFDNAKSFRVLYDSMKLLSDIKTPQVSWNKYIKLSKARKNIEYSGTTTDGLNKLYLLVLSDSAAISHPAFHGFATLTYSDS